MASDLPLSNCNASSASPEDQTPERHSQGTGEDCEVSDASVGRGSRALHISAGIGQHGVQHVLLAHDGDHLRGSRGRHRVAHQQGVGGGLGGGVLQQCDRGILPARREAWGGLVSLGSAIGRVTRFAPLWEGALRLIAVEQIALS